AAEGCILRGASAVTPRAAGCRHAALDVQSAAPNGLKIPASGREESAPCGKRRTVLASLAMSAARYRVLGSTIAVALAVLVAAVGSASAHRTAKLPSKIVGSWSRSLTAADWARVGIATEPPAHFSMLVSADGSVVMGESVD